MPANYTYYDAFGIERTVLSVLAPVRLTDVATNVTPGTEHRVTVNSTAALFPGMPFSCPNIPQGAFIHAILSDTVVELRASAWDATTGVFTTSAANAAATAAATGLQAIASGFCPRTIVALTYPIGAWRNLYRSSANIGATTGTVSGTLTTGSAVYATKGFGEGMMLLPTAGTLSSGVFTASTVEYLKSDDKMATPLKRHNGEPWGFYIFVSTGGFQSLVQAIPGREPLYAGPAA